MKRNVLVVVLVGLLLPVGLLLIVPLCSDEGHLAAVDAARAHCAGEGWPSEKLEVGRYHHSEGFFGGRAVVDFRVVGTDPPKVLRVELRSPMHVMEWRSMSIGEVPARE